MWKRTPKTQYGGRRGEEIPMNDLRYQGFTSDSQVRGSNMFLSHRTLFDMKAKRIRGGFSRFERNFMK